MLHFWLGRSSTRCLKCAIIRNRRPERQKSMFCVTWRQVCSFFRYFARAVGLFAGRPFPNGMNSLTVLHYPTLPVVMKSAQVHFFFLFEDALRFQDHYLIQKLCLQLATRPVLTKRGESFLWKLSFVSKMRRAGWEAACGGYFSLRKTSVGPPTFHSFGRRADRIWVYGLLIRNRWRL